jgi:hypothetical protein
MKPHHHYWTSSVVFPHELFCEGCGRFKGRTFCPECRRRYRKAKKAKKGKRRRLLPTGGRYRARCAPVRTRHPPRQEAPPRTEAKP